MLNLSIPTFQLSIEPVDGVAFRHGFHLGTQLPLAMQIAEEKLHSRNKHGMPTRTVALFLDGKMVDCYDGLCWSSRLGFDEEEAA